MGRRNLGGPSGIWRACHAAGAHPQFDRDRRSSSSPTHSHTSRLFSVLLAILACCVLAWPAFAVDDEASELEKPLVRWGANLDTIEKTIERLRKGDGDIPPIRRDIQAIQSEADSYIQKLEPELKVVQDQLAKLGEEPDKDAPPEPRLVTTERQRLKENANKLDGAIKRAQQLALRGGQLITSLDALRRARFQREVFEKEPSPLSPRLWQEISPDLGRGVGSLAVLWSSWWARAEPHYRLFLLLAGAIGIAVGLRLLLTPWSRRRAIGEEQQFFRKAASAARATFARAMPTIAAAAVIYLGLAYLDLLPPSLSHFVAVTFEAIVIYAIASSLARSLIAPNAPQWRLIPISDGSAGKVTRLIKAVAAVYAIAGALTAMDAALALTSPIQTLHRMILIWVFVALLASLLLTTWYERTPTQPRPSKLWPAWVKLPLWGVVFAILGASLLGYTNLAQFIAGQVIVTGTIIQLIWLFHWAVRELVADLSEADSPAAHVLSHHFRMGRRTRRVTALALGLVLNLLVIAAGATIIAFNWGFSLDTLQEWVSAAFFGFEIAGFRISIARIMVALLLFAAVLIATRFFRDWLDQSVLLPPRVEAGLANSIRTVVGYVGITLAAMLGVSYAGFDLTNIAIVAGALSVGIGFGLQSIVNNFVSGLILLVERPIKVGDWVEAGDTHGYVRRISVRSTEIETFDRASVIVPNSELIAGRVTNWTHRNTIGRVIVRIGVSYDSDPEAVSELLLQVGRGQEKVLEWPQPYVVFEDFGASSLDFSLRVYIADVNDVLTVNTDLRAEIFKAFRAAGIEIPFPQQDVHLRDLDLVKAAIARSLAERNGAGSE